ncbi:MAG TPA: alpha/beta hydrolase [Puia sp.]|jgi:pimeloyl-ACP methyl ester carboxylesterase|nr:alpha/beta hydrolase [Puia sp.]
MRKKWLWAIPLVLIIIYLLGPAPATPSYKTEEPVVPADALQLETYIKNNESLHKLKADNQARIVWASDSSKQKTAYAIVYLHGFSASQAEGDPIHKNIAREFGCNLYLSRLAEHGIDTVDAMINLTADAYWESAKQALAIGRQLGTKVILMGTSTGGTQALQLAASYPAEVAALVLLSPNIAINDPNAWLANNHWGLQIAQAVLGSKYIDSKDLRPINQQYWYTHYRAEAVAALEEMLETTMNKETFEKVKQPVQLLYFYKDEAHQDSTVKVSAMLKMFGELGTPDSLKRKQAMPSAGTHVIGSYIRSRDVEGVQMEIEKFMTQVLHLKGR